VPLQPDTTAWRDTHIDLTGLTFRRSTAVYGSGGEQVKDLTPKTEPHPRRICARRRSACRDIEARPSAVRTPFALGGWITYHAAPSVAAGAEAVFVVAKWWRARRIEDACGLAPIIRGSRR
jgi:hypothetical protein